MEFNKQSGEEFVALMGQRRSHPRLEEPAPDEALLHKIFNASLRTPDHMHLRPWRFLTIAGSDRQMLGNLFAKDLTSKNPEADSTTLEAAVNKAFRAPLIVVGVASYKDNDRVPKIEQAIAAAGVLQNMGMAVYANGFGAVWRTGPYASSAVVKKGLGVKNNEEIIGYLYVGTPSKGDRPLKPISTEDFFSPWPGTE